MNASQERLNDAEAFINYTKKLVKLNTRNKHLLIIYELCAVFKQEVISFFPFLN